MCEQNEPWNGAVDVNCAENYTFENGVDFIENESEAVAFWQTKGEPEKFGNYLVGVKTDKGFRIEIAEYFRREDDYPNLRRWSMHINGEVVCWAELPMLPTSLGE